MGVAESVLCCELGEGGGVASACQCMLLGVARPPQAGAAARVAASLSGLSDSFPHSQVFAE